MKIKPVFKRTDRFQIKIKQPYRFDFAPHQAPVEIPKGVYLTRIEKRLALQLRNYML